MRRIRWVLVVTLGEAVGVGMLRLSQSPIEQDDQSQADQARRFTSAVDAHVE
jgi:hypothetical protein